MAGCTMGVLSLDPLKLKLKLLEGTAEEKAWATAVLPVLQSHHHLLVALLLCNAAANEALPIFLNRLVDEGTAVLISVTCVLIFGEILPSAVMTGPAQLRIAAAVAPFIKGLLIVTAPISWPMAKGLDLWLGHQDGMTRFKRNEFKALIKLQHRAKGWKARADRPTWSRAASRSNLSRQGSGKGGSISAPISAPSSAPSSAPPAEKIKQLAEMINGQRSLSEASSDKSPLPAAHEKHGSIADVETEFSDDEVTILHSVFSLQAKRVVDLLEDGRNCWEDVRMLGEHQAMDMGVMRIITSWGVSRIPIYRGARRNNIIGLLLVKDHITLDPDDAVPIEQLRLRRPMVVPPSYTIFDMLNGFQTGRSHMALVSEQADVVEDCWRRNADVPEHVIILGVVTIEDIVEELIGEEVLDECDNPVTEGEKTIASSLKDLMEVTPLAPATERERALAYSARDPLLG